LGHAYSVLIPAGFAIIPIYVYGDTMGWW